MTTLADFPGAPPTAYVEGDWLILGEQGYTVEEWSRLGRKFGRNTKTAPTLKPTAEPVVPVREWPFPITEHQRDLIEAYGELGLIKLVAERFGIAESSVKNQLSSAYQRLDVRNGMQAVRRLQTEQAA